MIISLDGADGRLIDLATQDGMLPHLSALRNRGRAWPLSASKDDTDDSLWASFQYGVDLGAHGRSFYRSTDAQGNAIFPVHRETDWDIFWDDVSSAGHRVAVIDVPKCRTVRPLNGIHLADWLVHGRYSQTPTSYPPALAAQVVARFGEAPASKCGYSYKAPIDDAAARTARQNILRSVEMKRDAGLHFLSQEPWDLFVLAFKETHCSAHMFWDIHDCDHRNHDQDKRARIGDPVIDILKAVDLAIGDLIAKAGPDCDVVVFSTTNIVPNGTLEHLIGAIANRLNNVFAARTNGRWSTRLRSLLGHPGEICRVAQHNDNAGGLHVPRIAGESTEAHRARAEAIAAVACELVDAASKVPVIASVSFPAFEQTGPYADSLPHILLHYRTDICPAAVTSPTLGRIRARAPIERPGNHAPGGYVIAAGDWADTAATTVNSMKDFAGLARRVFAKQ